MKLFHVLTTTDSLIFLRKQASFMQANGLDVHTVSSPGPDLIPFGEAEKVSVYSIVMKRDWSLSQAAVSIAQLYRLFRRERPDIVHSHTPKASLVAVSAAWAARVPCRIFQIHGLPHTTASGFFRLLLKWSTQIPYLLATQTLCVSASAAKYAEQEGICTRGGPKVLHNGSINGVDAQEHFNPIKFHSSHRQQMLGLDDKELVIGFAGRLVRDKGVGELYEAWRQLRLDFPNAHLLIAGSPEERDGIPASLLQELQRDPRIHMLGQVQNMSAFYASLDLFVLPTYREGLPTVLLESAAMGVPCVATDAVGCVDVVVNGQTGTLVPVGDSEALATAMRAYLGNACLRAKHGQAARERVLRDFKPEDVWAATLEEYLRLLALSVRGGILRRVVKRALDLTGSAVGLLLLAPVLALVALLVRLGLGSPVLFRQSRPGLHGKCFMLLKFRTMRDSQDAAGRPLPDAERLTPFGRFLRACSLDELPELWNVLKGEMSLVGPRPLLPEYLPLYNQHQKRRHAVKPGLTGWAQIKGRNALPWEEKFNLDVWYVDHQSLPLDLKILWRTLSIVLLGRGVSQDGHATMSKFMGNLKETVQ